MNRNLVVNYMKGKSVVSVPEVQAKFNLGYKAVRELFAELEESGHLVEKDELYYHYNAESSQDKMGLSRYKRGTFRRLELECNEDEAEESENDEDEYEVDNSAEVEDDEKEEVNEVVQMLRARLERRKQEILKQMEKQKKDAEFKEKWEDKVEVGLTFWRKAL